MICIGALGICGVASPCFLLWLSVQGKKLVFIFLFSFSFFFFSFLSYGNSVGYSVISILTVNGPWLS